MEWCFCLFFSTKTYLDSSIFIAPIYVFFFWQYWPKTSDYVVWLSIKWFHGFLVDDFVNNGPFLSFFNDFIWYVENKIRPFLGIKFLVFVDLFFCLTVFAKFTFPKSLMLVVAAVIVVSVMTKFTGFVVVVVVM